MKFLSKSEYEAATAATRDQRMAWWRDARFGMFVHYGLYSVRGRMEWAMPLENYTVGDYEKFADRSPFELSGGQKRAAAIAGVAAMKPQVLILDEPTAGLDPKAHKDVLGMIREVHEKTGNITVLVSNNMGDIAELADKVIVIDGGRMVTMGTPMEVFSKGELLKSVGLDLPPITEFCNNLGIKDTVLDLETAVGKIMELFDK